MEKEESFQPHAPNPSRRGARRRLRPILVASTIAGVLVALSLLSWGSGARAATPKSAPREPFLPGMCSDSDRFGFATTVFDRVLRYDMAPLHAGWYDAFYVVTAPPRPAGAQFVQMIRLCELPGDDTAACGDCPGYRWCPPWAHLEAIIQSSPGAIWLVGNEPDSMSGGQDNITPGRYAELYKVYYDWLKAHDPTCTVGIAGVVQPTPIRLEYLEAVLDAYAEQNPSEPFMPIDVWNAHNYVLREKRYAEGCPDCWGAGVPPGDLGDQGILYSIGDHYLLDPCDPAANPGDPDCASKIGWKQHLINLRQLMKERGYQDRPLIITEFGDLMPAEYGYGWEATGAFMEATFDWLMTAADEELGDPDDNFHLVQAWAWWPFDTSQFGGMAGQAHLFNPATRALTVLGEQYSAYTAKLTTPFPGAVDLQALSVQDEAAVSGESGVLVPIIATIANGGDAATSSGPFSVEFYRDGVLAEVREVPQGLDGQQVMTVEVDWLAQAGDVVDVRIRVTGTEAVECDLSNGSASARLWAGDHEGIYLPLIVEAR